MPSHPHLCTHTHNVMSGIPFPAGLPKEDNEVDQKKESCLFLLGTQRLKHIYKL